MCMAEHCLLVPVHTPSSGRQPQGYYCPSPLPSWAAECCKTGAADGSHSRWQAGRAAASPASRSEEATAPSPVRSPRLEHEAKPAQPMTQSPGAPGCMISTCRMVLLPPGDREDARAVRGALKLPEGQRWAADHVLLRRDGVGTIGRRCFSRNDWVATIPAGYITLQAPYSCAREYRGRKAVKRTIAGLTTARTTGTSGGTQ